MKKLKKAALLAIAISKRFINSKQELAIQTTAGIIREAVAGKGGHNQPKTGNRPYGEKRVKKDPYNKARWGTLSSQVINDIPVRYVQDPKVEVHEAKAAAYQSKLSSRKWRKAAGDR